MDPTLLSDGIPTLAEVDALLGTDRYARHAQSNRAFLEKHAAALRVYKFHWGLDPLKFWSRRWEYPFAAQKVEDYLADCGVGATVLDAGSGVTYFPYYLCDRLPNAKVVCCDNDGSYPPIFEAINANVGHRRVSFVEAALQNLPMADDSLDAICCISVLEHTANYGQIVDEFARVLRPGGLLVLTFDLSLDDKFELPRDQAEALLTKLDATFDLGELNWRGELAKLDHPAGLLTTDAIQETQPELLPWRPRAAIAVRDLIKGKGWTGGFRSKSIFCLDARLPAAEGAAERIEASVVAGRPED